MKDPVVIIVKEKQNLKAGARYLMCRLTFSNGYLAHCKIPVSVTEVHTPTEDGYRIMQHTQVIKIKSTFDVDLDGIDILFERKKLPELNMPEKRKWMELPVKAQGGHKIKKGLLAELIMSEDLITWITN